MIGFAFTMTTGCGSSKPKMHKSGFFTDYSRLGKDPEGFYQWYYLRDDVVFGAYNKIIIDHVSFFLKEDAAYKGIQPEELIELAKHFHNAVIEALHGAYSFTSKPGPGTMRVRMAITDLVPGKTTSGTITTIVPVGLIASHVKKAATGSHIGIGGAAFEAELLDSQTNEVLAAVLDKKTGKKYKIGKSVTKWGQVDTIFNDWAKDFRKRLDKLSGMR